MLNDSQLIAVEQYEIKTIHRIWGLTVSSLSFFLVRREKRTRDANNYARRHRFSRLLASQLDARARARALPSLNLKKKRDCSQSTLEANR